MFTYVKTHSWRIDGKAVKRREVMDTEGLVYVESVVSGPKYALHVIHYYRPG